MGTMVNKGGMLGMVVAVAVVLACAGVVRAADESSVFVLTDDNFKEELAKHDLALVKFYAPWCGHCKSMAQSYIDAAEELKGTALLADLDATVNEKMAKEYAIQGFPTLKFFVKGEVLKDYKGGRDKDSIVAGVKKALDPAFETLENKEAVAAFLGATSAPRVLGVAPAALDSFKSAMNALGEELMGGALGLMTDVSLLPTGVKAKANSLVIVPQGEPVDSDQVKVVEIESTSEELIKSVKSGLVPVFGPLTTSNARLYLDLQPSLVTYFLEKPIAEAEYADLMKTVAKQMAEEFPKVKFVYTEGEELKGFKTYVFGEGVEPKIPIAVYQFGDDAKFTVDQDSELTAESLKAWIGKIATGELKPPLKSQPIPESQDSPVTKVVGLSFVQVCEDTTKDVLIMQYAPWCGHCKKLHPVWDAVAEKLKGEENLVIASMDATENDSPQEFKAKGYPTIQFFPAGGADMIPYEGGRTEEDIIKFIKANAKAPHSLKDEL